MASRMLFSALVLTLISTSIATPAPCTGDGVFDCGAGNRRADYTDFTNGDGATYVDTCIQATDTCNWALDCIDGADETAALCNTGVDLENQYGFDPPSCAGNEGWGNDWHVDRGNEFSMSHCYPRLVYCQDAVPLAGVYRTCPDVNEFFVTDNARACVASTHTSVYENCEISVKCNSDSIEVVVPSNAIWDQTAAGLQWGVTSGATGCDIPYTGADSQYTSSISLTSNAWSTCGITREIVNDNSGTATGIKYTAQVRRDMTRASGDARVEETHGATVTREKCFMMTAVCYYDLDGQASADFFPSTPNTLTASGTSELSYSLTRIMCDAGRASPNANAGQPTGSIYVTERICFRAAITTTWHDNIRVSLPQCWATSDTNNASLNVYQLGEQTDEFSGDCDDTFSWDCYAASNSNNQRGDTIDLNSFDFSFDAFRYQSGAPQNSDEGFGGYVQTMAIWCDINACEDTDTSSIDCLLPNNGRGSHGGDQCLTTVTTTAAPGPNRAKRDLASFSQLTKSRVHSPEFVVVNKPFGGRPAGRAPNSIFGDSLALGMFVTGCVLGVVAIGMMVALKRTKRQVRYGLVQS